MNIDPNLLIAAKLIQILELFGGRRVWRMEDVS